VVPNIRSHSNTRSRRGTYETDGTGDRPRHVHLVKGE
jgi:hypothetical protein